jgi:hypothetical protein
VHFIKTAFGETKHEKLLPTAGAAKMMFVTADADPSK